MTASKLQTVGNSFTAPPCSACNNNTARSLVVNGHAHPDLRVCDRCGAVLGRCWRGDSPVLLVFCPTEAAKAVSHSARRRLESQLPDPRFFDLDLVGSAGVERVHGWFNPATMKVVQFG